MGERHDAERSVREARERLSQVALELSRRASGDYVKARAREKAEDVSYRAKRVARERTIEMKDRLIDNPWALGFIGGVVGTVAGRMIGQKARESRTDTSWRGRGVPYDEYTATSPGSYGYGEDYGYGGYNARYGGQPHVGYDTTTGGSWAGGYREGGYDYGAGTYQPGEQEGGGIKDKFSERAEHLKENAGELQGRVRERAEHFRENAGHMRENLRDRYSHAKHSARERIPSRDEFRGRAMSMRRNADEHPGIWALAALATGAFLGAMVPVSARERQAMGPIKARAREQLHDLQGQARERVQHMAGQVKERVGLGEEEPAGGNGQWREGAGTRQGAGTEVSPTYHASPEGGSFAPSYQTDVERAGAEGGYGGGSVGVGDRGGISAGESEGTEPTRH